MTREEAIQWLTDIKENITENWSHDVAIDMAIEALTEPSGDLISRADAIKAVASITMSIHLSDVICDKLLALPSAEAKGDLISRQWLLDLYATPKDGEDVEWKVPLEVVRQNIKDAPSAEAVQGWRTGKPKEQGEYMVTLDSFGHKHIELFYYGKPLMPNRKVRGKCWYRSDDEWGDVVYDDKDILAWMPLPKPYKGGDPE